MVSIIIVNYHTKHLVQDCISSIIEYTNNLDYEIILVDNHSENLSELSEISKRIRVLHLCDNLGFGGANNKGAEIAKGEILFFLNPDTLLINNAIKILHDYLNSNKDVGIVGGNLYDLLSEPAHSYGEITLCWKHCLRRAFLPSQYCVGIKHQHNFTLESKNVGFITGADLMIRKDVFVSVGGFCPQIFMYYEDVELNYKVKQLGLKIISVPEAKIKHLEGCSLADGNQAEKIQKRNSMNAKSQASFCKLHHSKLYSYSMLYFYLTNLYLRKFILSLIGRKSEGNIQNIQLHKKVVVNLKQMYSNEETFN